MVLDIILFMLTNNSQLNVRIQRTFCSLLHRLIFVILQDIVQNGWMDGLCKMYLICALAKGIITVTRVKA